MVKDNLPPAPHGEHPPQAQLPAPWEGVSVWGDRDPMAEESDGPDISVGRIVAALLRFKWLVVAGVLLGAVGAAAAYRMVAPVYRTGGALWVNIEGSRGPGGGPIAQGGLLQETAWIDLLKSFAVLDPVVIEQQLYIHVADRYRPVFADFDLANRFVPGRYVLEVNENGSGWSLSTHAGLALEQGGAGERAGAERGFLWTPAIAGVEPGSEIDFEVMVPRDAAQQLSDELQARMDQEGNFIRLYLTGTDPERITRTLDAVLERHVQIAAQLKRAKQDELTEILAEQLQTVQRDLEMAENELESFRVATVTLPSEEASPIAPGIEQTRGPVFQEYFQKRTELDGLQLDLERLQAILDSLPQTGVRVESFEMVPSVASSTELRQALTELTQKRADRRGLLTRYTADYEPVQELTREIEDLETSVVPSLTRSLMAQLQTRELELQQQVAMRSSELQEIPPRSIEEARLRREVASAERLYVDLLNRFETARLAAASSIPDIRILDEPRVPAVPSDDERIRWAAMVFFGFFGTGLAGAVLLDWFDPRFRYLSEVSDEIGLEILGAVPRLRSGRRDNSQAVFEAFRDIRMRAEFAHGTARPMVMAVTSPDTGEGKTFVAANLAISFAQLGRSTLLIDADTRRGDLHDLFDQDRKPGLTDLLEGVRRDGVIRRTAYEKLHFLPSGRRRVAAPELLSSAKMQQMLGAVKPRYDVIIIDSPPMAAGSDAFVLGAHAGNLLLVLRSGSTHKELTKGKLDGFLRLPVRILGGVLNDVEEDAALGSYKYYSYYLPDYVTEVDEPAGDEEEYEPSPTPVAP